MPGFKSPIISKALSKPHSSWVGRVGAEWVSIPTDLIKYLEQSRPVYAIPGTGSPLMGLIQDQTQLVPQFNSNPAIAAQYNLLLKTPKGDISLAVGEIRKQGDSDVPTLTLDGWLSDLVPGLPASRVNLESPPVATKSLLLIKTATHVYAVDPALPYLVEKHASNTHWRGQSVVDRLIELTDGSLVHGLSLSALLENDLEANELWSLLVHNPVTHEDAAITVPHVLGLEKIPLERIHFITKGKHKAQWINHPNYGQVEWLDLTSLINPGHDSKFTLVSNKKKAFTKTMDKATQTSHDIVIPYLNFGLIIPGNMIEVVGPLMIKDCLVNADEPNAQPVFDLLGLLDLSTGITLDSRILRLKTSNGQSLSVLVPDVSALDVMEEDVWFPKPMLPAQFSPWVAKVRLADQVAQYLLDYVYFDQILKQVVVNAKHHPACVGWLPSDFFDSTY